MESFKKSLSFLLSLVILIGAGWFLYKKFYLDIKPQEYFLEKPKVIVGISTTSSRQYPLEQQAKQIASLWGDFNKDVLTTKIPNEILGSKPYGVYHSYEEDGKYMVTAGVRVSSVDEKENSYTYITIPVGKYLIFSNTKNNKNQREGDLAVKTWSEVNKFFAKTHKYKRAFQVDFEEYLEGKINIYISYLEESKK